MFWKNCQMAKVYKWTLGFHKKFAMNDFWQEKRQKTEWTKNLRTDSVYCYSENLLNDHQIESTNDLAQHWFNNEGTLY